MSLRINLAVDGSSQSGLEEGAKKIAVQVKPDWNENNLKYQVYTDGITNQLIGVWCGEKNGQLLVRVYGQGTEMFIDRDSERRNIEILHSVGCAPELLAVFNNGICYAFTVGIPATPSLIVQEPVWRAVTQEMAKFHRTEGGDKSRPSGFPKIRHFWGLVPENFESEKQSRLDERKYNKKLLHEEINELEQILTSLGCPIVFSHNDLLLGNVIWNEHTKKASFIDFEYGAANYQAFDIGNHFNEFAGVDEVDYTLYPNKEFQYKWLRSYLSHYLAMNEDEVSEKEIEKWYIWTNKFALASHMFWTCWALVQAQYSKIDFDFLGYSIIRLDEYFRRKNEFLSLTPTEEQQD